MDKKKELSKAKIIIPGIKAILITFFFSLLSKRALRSLRERYLCEKLL